jgi:hypothetical protein
MRAKREVTMAGRTLSVAPAPLAQVDEPYRAWWGRAMHLTQQRIFDAAACAAEGGDGCVFAALIESPHLDWRCDLAGCRYRMWDVPVEVAGPGAPVVGVAAAAVYALDFGADPAGRWWFLETNPNGQWLWIEQETAMPIAAAPDRTALAR